MSTDPTALAREVLDAAHEDETITVCSIPDNKVATLARAVIELTARLDAERFAHANSAMRIKCVEALAEKYETTARGMGAGSYGGALAAKIARAIRAALNGDNT